MNINSSVARIIKIMCLLVAAAFIASCATMSKDECLHADWYLKGVDDAMQGYAENRIVDHGKACARVKITPNTQEYFSGHKKGARLFCVPEKGFSEGRRGAAYNGICPVDLEHDFLRAYRDGQELFVIQRNIENLTNEIDNNRSLIDRSYDEMSQLKHEIVNSDDEKERRYKMRRIDDLQSEITSAEIQIDRAARELELFRHDFHIVEEKHYRMGYLN